MNQFESNRQDANTPRDRNRANQNHSNVLKNIRMILRRVLLSIILVLIVCGYAQAHVFPDHAEPKVGSHIGKSPKEVKIWFNGEVESAFSKIEIFGGDGGEVDNRDSRVDEKNKTLLIVSVPALLPGEYKVVWHAVATDTHRTSGNFKFTIDQQN
jgi:methionine-rich copper-binding protein CopC